MLKIGNVRHVYKLESAVMESKIGSATEGLEEAPNKADFYRNRMKIHVVGVTADS